MAMCSACLAPSLSMAVMMLFSPPLPSFSGTLISSVEKLMCMPAPFQSPCDNESERGGLNIGFPERGGLDTQWGGG